MNGIEDNSIDMILCDLPYGTTRNKWDSTLPLDNLWQQYERIIKDRGCIALFSQTPFDKVLGGSNLKLLKYEWIYKKSRPTGHLNAKRMPMKEHENILIFYKKQPIYNYGLHLTELEKPIVRNSKWRTNKGNYGNMGKDTIQTKTGYLRDVIEFLSVGTHKNLHPTQKPIKVCEFLIELYTNKDDLVLDNCIGSGTTAIACLNTNRNFIGIELQDEYYKIAKDRVNCHIIDNNLQDKYELLA